MPMIPVSEVAGSASDAFKETSLRSFNKFMWTKNDRFASDVATAVRVKEISVDDDAESPAPGRRITKVVCEIDVTEHMCNYLHFLHGGCAAYLVDMLTSHALIGSAFPVVSLNLNINYHAPARLGATIYAVNTTVATGSRVVTAQAQIYDKKTGKLLITAQHMKMQPSPVPARGIDASTPSLAPDPSASIAPPAAWRQIPRITDPALLLGTAPLAIKTHVWEQIEHWEQGGLFALAVGRTVRLQEMHVDTVAGKRMATMVCEVEVLENMTNGLGSLHGGCASFLVDRLTGTMQNPFDGIMVSMNLNVTFHAPAPKGTMLRIVAKTVTSGKRISTSRAEIFDARTKRLLVTGTHTMMQPASSNL